MKKVLNRLLKGGIHVKTTKFMFGKAESTLKLQNLTNFVNTF